MKDRLYGYSRSLGAARFTSTRYRSDEEDKLLIKLFLLSVAAVIFMYGWLIYTHNFRYTWLVAKATWPLYVTVLVVWAWGVVWWKKNDGFNNAELAFYMTFTIAAVVPTVCMGFLFLTDLGDTEVWNGSAQRVEWEESHYTESTDKEGKKSKTHYSASYTIYTSNGRESVSIDQSTFDTYVKHWGGWGRVSSRRILFADGEDWSGSNHNGIPETHTISWDGRNETKVPTSVEHTYANFLKASDSVLKIQGVMGGWEKFLVAYPRVYGGTMGPIYFNRVIDVGGNVPSSVKEVVQRDLTDALCTLGARKECNIIVYVVGTEDQGVFSAIEEKWIMGKMNDVVVCIGYTDGQIRFCRCLSWTTHTLFIEKLEAAVRSLGTLNGKGADLARAIVTQVDAPGDAGFLRKPMSELAYLASDVKMPFWAFLLVGLAGCIIMLPTILLVKDGN